MRTCSETINCSTARASTLKPSHLFDPKCSMTSRSLGPALAPLPDGGDGERQPRTWTLAHYHDSLVDPRPLAMPLALAAASPRRSGCRLSSRLRSWKAKLKSWMLNIRVLCTGIRGERRQAGRRASPASAGAALVSTSSLDTTTPSVVGGGECAGSVAGRGPVGSGPGGQAARLPASRAKSENLEDLTPWRTLL